MTFPLQSILWFYFKDPSTFQLFYKYSGYMESDCITRCTKPLYTAFCLQSLELTLTKHTRYADKFALSEGIAFLAKIGKENCHGFCELCVRAKTGVSEKVRWRIWLRRGKKKNSWTRALHLSASIEFMTLTCKKWIDK